MEILRKGVINFGASSLDRKIFYPETLTFECLVEGNPIIREGQIAYCRNMDDPENINDLGNVNAEITKVEITPSGTYKITAKIQNQ
jgi:hypothetical protein